jgi:hypothetical protein
MKNIFKNVAMSLCVALVPLSAGAAEVAHDGTIARLYADDNGSVYIQLKNIDFDGCATVKNNHYYTLTDAHPRFEELYALALTAAHSQDEISIRIDESTCNGTSLANSPIVRITQNF